ncbi:MAG TPA: carboxypeptidase M32 [Chloroflexota bacterium]|nr:carboxypeptidase M32 [Chloroflexota bacterium]
MGEHFDRLRQRLATIHNIDGAIGVLGWDQQTYMPPAGARARAEQMATLGQISHDLFISEETGELLQAAAEDVRDLPYESDEASLVRVSMRDYQQRRKIPAELVAEITRHGSTAYAVWTQARREDDYDAFAPYLQKTVEYSRQVAELLGYEEQLYDALLDQFEPGMTTSQVLKLFDELKQTLVPLVQRIADGAARIDDSFLHQDADEAKQETFGKMVAERYGYDFNRGRLDRTVHPFETAFSRDDVRITTRYEPNLFTSALFSTLHETGHALYEQGVGENLEGTILARGTSLGVHESQSRMWENVIGRSRDFWEQFYPVLQQTFPAQLAEVDLERFYRAVNKVEPSLIRIEADEVTYNLHIMLRLEMELGLLSGEVTVQDAPHIWNEKMQSYLGVTPPTNALGILQDVHWSNGIMGYFTTYSLGNILSLQFFEKAVEARPEIPQEIRRGSFDSLRGWLTENVYRHGRKFTPVELVKRATGGEIRTAPYLNYLQTKFADVYAL